MKLEALFSQKNAYLGRIVELKLLFYEKKAYFRRIVELEPTVTEFIFVAFKGALRPYAGAPLGGGIGYVEAVNCQFNLNVLKFSTSRGPNPAMKNQESPNAS